VIGAGTKLPLAPDDDRRAIEGLFELVDEYLAEASGSDPT